MKTRDWIILATCGAVFLAALCAVYVYFGCLAVFLALAACYLVGSAIALADDEREFVALVCSLNDREGDQ